MYHLWTDSGFKPPCQTPSKLPQCRDKLHACRVIESPVIPLPHCHVTYCVSTMSGRD
ncbi:hypothetical protein CY34DRAFT_804287 [Suillus luteus UH-Slu-Lm8-n1]|uniref:Uncharacterized protein n=1 Tax=Suillus luteus UH-Slu-Lm8-n1 TaxID=930992 RepID=A0A0D0AZ74_9AGAM|nr:hypothetical protein CY34DRAFT_804287 [Suillus luteus UH-Slu-Lm8-n1]